MRLEATIRLLRLLSMPMRALMHALSVSLSYDMCSLELPRPGALPWSVHLGGHLRLRHDAAATGRDGRGY